MSGELHVLILDIKMTFALKVLAPRLASSEATAGRAFLSSFVWKCVEVACVCRH